MAAQSVVAANRSVDDAFVMHSLHSYFLRPGDPAVPIVYDVERIRDGRSFATRRVMARQHGRPIYYLTANFQKPEDGFEHQDRMPDVVGPDQGVRMADLARQRGPEAAQEWEREWSALDVRYLGTSAMGLPEDPEHPARAQLWIRIAGDLDDDPLTHRAAFTYASDLTLLGAVAGAARRPLRDARHADGLAGPHGVVPPAVPGRPSGGSTTRCRRRRSAAAAWPLPGSSPRTAPSWRPSPRRASSGCATR